MSLIDQVILAVEASAKVVGSVFLASLAVIVFDFYVPKLFVGLPLWVMPLIRIIAIFTLVLSIAFIARSVIGTFKRFGTFIRGPFKKRFTERTLLELSIAEVYVLSIALAKGDRTIRIKPDLAIALALQDKGLIKPYWSGVILGDGLSSFEVPQDVWRVILSMEEFRMLNPSVLVDASEQSAGEAKIRAALPQGHPSVLSE